jgi:hypothetical protein
LLEAELSSARLPLEHLLFISGRRKSKMMFFPFKLLAPEMLHVVTRFATGEVHMCAQVKGR